MPSVACCKEIENLCHISIEVLRSLICSLDEERASSVEAAILARLISVIAFSPLPVMDSGRYLQQHTTYMNHQPLTMTQKSRQNEGLPNYFRNMFTLASQLHLHYTRNCNLYYIAPCRTKIRNFSIRFQGPKFFNSLSPEVQNSESIRLFGKRLKKFLLS